MVYAFGMEGIPLFEMLFIVIILMVVGLVVILIEIRKLRKLLTEETGDIKRFESDLDKFEADNKGKPPKELIAHVQNAVEKGIDKEQIQSSMQNQGWSKEKAQEVLKAIK